MPQQNDLSRSLISFEQATALVAVIELSKPSWLIAGTVPGDRAPATEEDRTGRNGTAARAASLA
jgi:transposase